MTDSSRSAKRLLSTKQQAARVRGRSMVSVLNTNVGVGSVSESPLTDDLTACVTAKRIQNSLVTGTLDLVADMLDAEAAAILARSQRPAALKVLQ
jgi:hypothetical protein